MPIIVQECTAGSDVTNSQPDDTAAIDIHQLEGQLAASSTRVNTYTLVISESNSKPVRKSNQFHSSDQSGSCIQDEHKQLLHPSAYQALRTAHWVESTAKTHPQSSKCITQAEISHDQESSNSVECNTGNIASGNRTRTSTPISERESIVDLATSEV